MNSPVRAFRSVGGNPRFIKSGKGSHVVDVDGNSYIDYLGSWGPLILGHCPAPVQAALKKPDFAGHQLRRPDGKRSCAGGDDYRSGSVDRKGAAGEFRHGSDDERHPPGAGVYRAATRSSSSTAAITDTWTACWLKPGSGVATLGLPDSPGVQPQDCSSTISVPYNDGETVQQVLEAQSGGSRRRHRRTGCGQHGNGAAGKGIPAAAAQADARAWSASDL